MFKSGDKVILKVGNLTFERTVSEVVGEAVYLEEGGNCFYKETGTVWGDGKVHSRIYLAGAA